MIVHYVQQKIRIAQRQVQVDKHHGFAGIAGQDAGQVDCNTGGAGTARRSCDGNRFAATGAVFAIVLDAANGVQR